MEIQELEKEFFNLRAKSNGLVLEKQKQLTEKRQKECNHRKGGFCEVKEGKYTGNYGPGFGPDYAVMKHMMFWGDTWIRCLRCGKWWKPGDKGYKKALHFPTMNTMSTSIQLRVDVNQARELTKES